MKLQGSEVQDHETLQSQIGKIAENKLPLSGLQIFHGRRLSCDELGRQQLAAVSGAGRHITEQANSVFEL